MTDSPAELSLELPMNLMDLERIGFQINSWCDKACPLVPDVLSVMHKGYKILVKSLKRNENGATLACLEWLRLTLRLQASMDRSNGEVRQLFAKYAVTFSTYIVGCMQVPPTTEEFAEFQLEFLKLYQKFTLNLECRTLGDFANLKLGPASLLWKALNSMGDYRAQRLTLDLVLLLLRECESSNCLTEILKIAENAEFLGSKIHDLMGHFARDEIRKREFLKQYNNQRKKPLAYSFDCTEVWLGDMKLKPAEGESQLYLNFNLVTGAVNVKGQCAAGPYHGSSVEITVRHGSLKLDGTTLTVGLTSKPSRLTVSSIVDEHNLNHLEIPKEVRFLKAKLHKCEVKDSHLQRFLKQTILSCDDEVLLSAEHSYDGGVPPPQGEASAVPEACPTELKAVGVQTDFSCFQMKDCGNQTLSLPDKPNVATNEGSSLLKAPRTRGVGQLKRRRTCNTTAATKRRKVLQANVCEANAEDIDKAKADQVENRQASFDCSEPAATPKKTYKFFPSKAETKPEANKESAKAARLKFQELKALVLRELAGQFP